MLAFLVVFLAVCVSVESGPCTEYNELPFGDLRFVNNVYEINEEAISDRFLTEGWYRVGDEDMPVTSPPFTSCGTKSPIWLDGTIPSTVDQEVNRTACLVVGGLPCAAEYDIRVIHCTGQYRVYYLVPTAGSEQCYCFGEGTPGTKPSYVPPKVEVKISIVPHGGLTAFAADCVFEESGDPTKLYYQLTWYIDGTYYTSFKPEFYNDIQTIILDKSNLINLGKSVSCSVRARLIADGRPGLSVKSVDQFIGIEVLTPLVHIVRGETGVIRFRPTVPIGCLPPGDCKFNVAMYFKQPHDCHRITSTGQTSCGATMSTKNWTDIYEISVAIEEEEGRNIFSAIYDVVLRTDEYLYHPIWSHYTLPLIKVSVEDETLDDGTCEARNDPHMLTHDGRPYDIQFPGDFILYQHTEYPIQVQTRFHSCSNNGRRPYCVFGAAIQAGRDVFVIDRSPNSYYADYKVCQDSALDVRQVGERKYRIYTPIGTRIEVNVYSIVITVHVFPSARDKGKTEGLCGTMNKDCTDDFKMSDNTYFVSTDTKRPCEDLGNTDYRFQPDVFSDSWLVKRVSGAVNLFDDSIDSDKLTPWDRRFKRCRCNTIEGTINPEIECSASMVSTCARNERAEDQVDTCRVHKSSASFKRGTNRNRHKRDLYNQRKKTAQPPPATYLTEEEAQDYCQNTLGNSELFHLCGDIPILNTEHAVQACVLDILLTNSTVWTDDSREAMQDRCLAELELNTTLAENGTGNNPSIASAIRQIACPGNCSGSGRCVNGTCDCDDGLGAADCSIDLSIPPLFEALMNDGMCDKQNWECDVAMAMGDDFIAKGHLKCKMEPFWYDTTGANYTEMDEIVTAEIQTFMNLFCPLTMSRRKRGAANQQQESMTFVEGYRVSLSNDGVTFGDQHTLFIFDSQCQTSTVHQGQQIFLLKDDHCYIEGGCRSGGDINPTDVCQECSPASSPYIWSSRTTPDCMSVQPESPKEESSTSYLWVMGPVGGILAAVVVVGIAAWRMKVRRSKKVKDSTISAQYTREVQQQ